ncbi:dynein heavy chain [Plasmodium gonderi]|uniref:Dynein heavy chain n=1 Tax=Plasmodium gonderi TaxID=77519 RepID=A0A1Y1JFY0_PLAGO|nr:dynein heavy chain [Plasmodium gonderi]GAW80117.1 dynein heavy chain [Plasmodium gonderi]
MERRNGDSQAYGMHKWVLNKLKFAYKAEYNASYLLDKNTDERKEAVDNFLCNEKNDILLFGIENDKMVVAKEENIKFDQKIVYFYKHVNSDMKDEKNILYGILSANILDTLKIMLRNVIYPLFLNNKMMRENISTDEIKKFSVEFDTYVKELNEFILILEDIKKVKLKMKQDQCEMICEKGINDKNEASEQTDTSLSLSLSLQQQSKTGNGPENKMQKKKNETAHLTKYLNILENLFNDMNKKIQEYTKSNVDVGPFIEIQYWRYKHRYLLFIIEELRSNEIKNIIDNININNANNEEQKYTYTFDILNKWRELETKIENEFNESKDNIKYLESIEQFILSLYLCNVENIIDNIPSLLNSIKMIYLVARFYNTPSKLNNLFIKITNQLVIKCKEEIFCAKRKKKRKRRRTNSRRDKKRSIIGSEYGDTKSEKNMENFVGDINNNDGHTNDSSWGHNNDENYMKCEGKRRGGSSNFNNNSDNENEQEEEDYEKLHKNEEKENGYMDDGNENGENGLRSWDDQSNVSDEDRENEDMEENMDKKLNERDEGYYSHMKDNEHMKIEHLTCRQNLWLLDPDDLIDKFELCFKLYEKYKEEFENIKTFLENNSKNKSVDLNTKVIFCKIEIFCRRLKKLVDLFLCIKQFKSLRRIKFDCVKNITASFNKYIKEFKMKHTEDMLNYTDNYFDRDFVELRVYISELESDLQESIVNLLNNSSNIMLSFFIFFKFKEHFIRDYLIEFLRTKYDILISQFLEILNTINNDLENSKTSLNSNKSINYLKNIFWILSIKYKINYIIKVFLDENNSTLSDKNKVSSYFELPHLNNNLSTMKIKTNYEQRKEINNANGTITTTKLLDESEENVDNSNVDLFYSINDQVLKLMEDHERKKITEEGKKDSSLSNEMIDIENAKREEKYNQGDGEVKVDADEVEKGSIRSLLTTACAERKEINIKNILFKNSNGKEVLKLYLKISKFIEEYKNKLFKHWLCFIKSVNSLNVTVFVKHPKTKNVIVNFDNRIKRIIREAKMFLSFKFEIPEEVKNMITQESKIYSFYYKLYNILILIKRMKNNKKKDIEITLKRFFVYIDQLLLPFLVKYTWSNYALEDSIDNLQKEVTEFEETINSLYDIIDDHINYNTKVIYRILQDKNEKLLINKQKKKFHNKIVLCNSISKKIQIAIFDLLCNIQYVYENKLKSKITKEEILSTTNFYYDIFLSTLKKIYLKNIKTLINTWSIGECDSTHNEIKKKNEIEILLLVHEHDIVINPSISSIKENIKKIINVSINNLIYIDNWITVDDLVKQFFFKDKGEEQKFSSMSTKENDIRQCGKLYIKKNHKIEKSENTKSIFEDLLDHSYFNKKNTKESSKYVMEDLHMEDENCVANLKHKFDFYEKIKEDKNIEKELVKLNDKLSILQGVVDEFISKFEKYKYIIQNFESERLKDVVKETASRLEEEGKNSNSEGKGIAPKNGASHVEDVENYTNCKVENKKENNLLQFAQNSGEVEKTKTNNRLGGKIDNVDDDTEESWFSDDSDEDYEDELKIYKEEENIKKLINTKKEINNIESYYSLNVFKINLESFKMYLINIIENEALECANKIIEPVRKKSDMLIKKMNTYKTMLKKKIIDVDSLYYVINVIKKIHVFESTIDIVLNPINEMIDILEFYMNNFLKKHIESMRNSNHYDEEENYQQKFISNLEKRKSSSELYELDESYNKSLLQTFNKLNLMKKKFVTLYKYEVEKKNTILAKFNELISLTKSVEEEIQEQKNIMKNELINNIYNFKEDIKTFRENFLKMNFKSEHVNPLSAFELLKRYKEEIIMLKKKYNSYYKGESIFGLKHQEHADLFLSTTEVNNFYSLYDLYVQLKEKMNEWKNLKWNEGIIKMKELKNEILSFEKKCSQLPKNLKMIVIYKNLIKEIFYFKEIAPIVEELEKKTILKRHWIEIVNILKEKKKKESTLKDKKGKKPFNSNENGGERSAIQNDIHTADETANQTADETASQTVDQAASQTADQTASQTAAKLNETDVQGTKEEKEETNKKEKTFNEGMLIEGPCIDEEEYMNNLNKLDLDNMHFFIKDIINSNLLQKKDDILDICDSAEKEASIEEKINEQYKIWNETCFQFSKWKNRDYACILVGSRVIEIQESLEESQILLNNINSTKYSKPFKSKLLLLLNKLSDCSDIVERWIKVQMLWCSMESVFTSGDIARQMPIESKRFHQIDKDWINIINIANESSIVIECCQSSMLKELLPNMQKGLESCQKSLESYLEGKRSKFPRFYFVSNLVLLKILSQGSDINIIQSELIKLFDAINYLTIKTTQNKKRIICINNKEKDDIETVQLVNHVTIDGNIENWLILLEKEMQKAVKKECKIGVSGSAQLFKTVNLKEFCDKNIAQVALICLQVMWTNDIEKCILKYHSEKNILKVTNKKINYIMSELVNICLSDLGTKLNRTKYETLVTIHVHQRDLFNEISAKIKEYKIKTSTDFDWLKQTRIYYKVEKNIILISISDVDFTYSYEYLGIKERLCITPLTDRCYLTCAQALGLCYGGAPAGPAGTGKTETVKDLGRTLGIYVIVTNCSNQHKYKDMAKIFKGLCRSGLWGCFDEFNRINLDVLSVVAMQIESIVTAKKQSLKSFLFPGDSKSINLNPSSAYFITMNPGYAGRQLLPENLKIFFRFISMMVPDRQIIIKVKLASVGYMDIDNLSNKFKSLYSLCEEQLSKQKHYDFGLRNILSVLRTAGDTKRAAGANENDEEMLLMRTLRDMNLSKLIHDDVLLFLSLLNDVFPKYHNITKKSYQLIEENVEQIIKKKKLCAKSKWILKILQLYETSLVRHGFMLVGNTLTGKTEILNILTSALTNIGNVTKIITLNPKAITSEHMYGVKDNLSEEWTPGIFANIWEKYNNNNLKYNTWIVCDGPVDAIWIENLNTVLDDNKILTLANNDRIPMTDNTKIAFEVENLNNASPATVSRAGIVYISDSDLGYKPFIYSWLQKLKDVNTYGTTLFQIFNKLFIFYLDRIQILNFVKENCKFVMEVTDSILISQTINLLNTHLIQYVNAINNFIYNEEDLNKIFFCNSNEKELLHNNDKVVKKHSGDESDNVTHAEKASSNVVYSLSVKSKKAKEIESMKGKEQVAITSDNNKSSTKMNEAKGRVPNENSKGQLLNVVNAKQDFSGKEKKRNEECGKNEEVNGTHANGGCDANEPSEEDDDDKMDPMKNLNITSGTRYEQVKAEECEEIMLYSILWGLCGLLEYKDRLKVHNFLVKNVPMVKHILKDGGNSNQNTSMTTPTTTSTNTGASAASTASAFAYNNNRVTGKEDANPKMEICERTQSGNGSDDAEDEFEKETCLIYDYYFDMKLRKLTKWNVSPFKMPKNMNSISSILIPTIETNKVEHIIKLISNIPIKCYNFHTYKSTLLLGSTGSAKTSIALLYSSKQDKNTKRFNFSSVTTPEKFQLFIESELERKTGKTYGPIGNTKSIIFIDDMSMPKINEWGDQSTLELLRQLIEFQGFYFLDKDKRGNFKKIIDLEYIGCINHPGCGNNDIPKRLKSKWFSVNIPPYNLNSINTIYGTVLRTKFNKKRKFSDEIIDNIDKIILCTINLFGRLKKHLLPVPSRFHYLYTTRDLAKIFYSMLLCPFETIDNNLHNFLCLWKHECERVLIDKLSRMEDKQFSLDQLKQIFNLYYPCYKGIADKSVYFSYFYVSEKEQIEYMIENDLIETVDQTKKSKIDSIDNGCIGINVIGTPTNRSTGDQSLDKDIIGSNPSNNTNWDKIRDVNNNKDFNPLETNKLQRGSTTTSGKNNHNVEKGTEEKDGENINLFSFSWMKKDYKIVVDFERLRYIAYEYMKEYNLNNVKKLDLVFFDDSLKHLIIINRVMETPKGSSMLVGVGGSGKRSLTKLSVFISEQVLFQLNITKTYTKNLFFEDLKSLYISAGQMNKKTTFLLSDSDIEKNDFILEHINSILSTGLVYGLFIKDEKEAICAEMKESYLKEMNKFNQSSKMRGGGGKKKKKRKNDCNLDDMENDSKDSQIRSDTSSTSSANNDSDYMSNEKDTRKKKDEKVVNDFNVSSNVIFDYLLDNFRNNLHIFLCFSPIHKEFALRYQQFPCIYNCVTINWFLKWPLEALVNVSTAYLNNFNIDIEEKLRDDFFNLFAIVHKKVSDTCETYRERMRRNTYVTPKSYLSFIDLYKQMYVKKYEEIQFLKESVDIGLKKLNEAAMDVQKMRENLTTEEEKLKESDEQTNILLEKVKKESLKAEKQSIEVSKFRDKCIKEKDIILKEQEEADKDLKAALPYLHEAEEAIKSITAKDITELKSMKTPSDIIRIVFDGVLILLQGKLKEPKISVKYVNKQHLEFIQDSFDEYAKPLMADIRFLNLLFDFSKNEKDNINEETIELLKPYIESPFFKTQIAKKASVAAEGLCKWVGAMAMYNQASKIVKPKMSYLKIQTGRLEDALKQLAEAEDSLLKAQLFVDNLKLDIENMFKKKKTLEETALKTKQRIEQANKLINGLASEKSRWTEDSDNFSNIKKKVVGDVFICSSFISYCGMFNTEFRNFLMNEVFYHYTKNVKNIPVSDNIDVIKYVLSSDDTKICDWSVQKLPNDRLSIENALISENSNKYVLLIDPQCQASNWIKNKEFQNDLSNQRCVTTFSSSKFKDSLEFCLSEGKALLIENVEEYIDPILDSVLEKQIIKKGRKNYILIENNLINFDENFNLFMTTNLPNPNYSPEIYAKCCVIDFTVTVKGLEDQLLGRVLTEEQKHLEISLKNIMIELKDNTKSLQDLDKQLLYKLNTSSSNLIEDEELIEVLNNTKLLSKELETKLKDSNEKKKEINEKREQYRSVALRGSILYFCIVDITNVNYIYNTSLHQFLEQFDLSIKRAEKGQHIKKRVESILSTLTNLIISYMERCLFDQHKIIFKLLISLKILLYDNIISNKDISFFLNPLSHYNPSNDISSELLSNNLLNENAGGGKGKKIENATNAVMNNTINNTMGSYLNKNDNSKGNEKDSNDKNTNENSGVGASSSVATTNSSNDNNVSNLNTDNCANKNKIDIHRKGGKNKISSTKWLFKNEKLYKNIISLSNHSFGNDKNNRFFYDILNVVQLNDTVWKNYYDVLDIENKNIPYYNERLDANSKISSFIKLCLIRCLREDRTILCANKFVDEVLNRNSDTIKHETLENIFAESSNRKPFLFLLSLASDPTNMIDDFAKKYKKYPTDKISMGEGQEIIAKEKLKNALISGSWLILQNCHLNKTFIIEVYNMLKKLNEIEEDFRLFLTLEPDGEFPICILHGSIKISTSLSRGIKNNMRKIYKDIVKEDILEKIDDEKYRKIIYSLSYLHCVLCERKKFGPLGWCVPYEFSITDLFASFLFIEKHLYSTLLVNRPIDWESIHYMLAEVQYGGKVTDDLDRELLLTYVQHYFNEDLFKMKAETGSENFHNMPKFYEITNLQSFIEKLPNIDTPSVLDLHNNAEITYRVNESRQVLNSILEIQPRDVDQGEEKSMETVVKEIAAGILLTLPAEINLEEIKKIIYRKNKNQQLTIQTNQPLNVTINLNATTKNFANLESSSHKSKNKENSDMNENMLQRSAMLNNPLSHTVNVGKYLSPSDCKNKNALLVTKENDVFDSLGVTYWDNNNEGEKNVQYNFSPLQVFFLQEIERIKNVIDLVKTNLNDIISAIDGSKIMTADLQNDTKYIYSQSVPKKWIYDASETEISWVCHNLNQWLNILNLRYEQIMNYIQNGKLKSYWLPGFFNPQGFLTSMKQEITRLNKKDQISLDEVVLYADIKNHDIEKIKEVPEHGFHIHGLFIEGSKWNWQEGKLEESSPKILCENMPVIHITVVSNKDKKVKFIENNKHMFYNCPVYKYNVRTDKYFVFRIHLKTDIDPSIWKLRGTSLLCSKD